MMTDESPPRYPAERAPTGMLRYSLVSITAAALVGWIFGGALLSYTGPATFTSLRFANFLTDVLNWGVIIVPFTVIASVVLVLITLAVGAGCARLSQSRWVRLAAIATVMTVIITLMVAFAFSAPADPINWTVIVPVSAVIGLSLAAGAVAPWKGGFANPTRVALPLEHN